MFSLGEARDGDITSLRYRLHGTGCLAREERAYLAANHSELVSCAGSGQCDVAVRDLGGDKARSTLSSVEDFEREAIFYWGCEIAKESIFVKLCNAT
jgi:hypothetical protein